MNMTSLDIKKLLAEKHKYDIAIAECKNGSTWFSKHRRLDFWAMKRSWANPEYIGYEIKTNRKDFLGDKKWKDYLPYCTRFYFVCPAGLIQKEEVPKEAGLYWVTNNGGHIYIKKQSPVYDAKEVHSLLLYVLICRSKINTFNENYKQGSKEYWEQWIKEVNDNILLGEKVGKKMRKRLEELYSVKRNMRRVELELRSMLKDINT